jgi:LuxR family transcriptional regulator, maltose regulon positive regulatory protein
MTPMVQGDTLVYQQDGHEQTLTVGTAAWYAWLETASTFAFVSDTGTFTARKEQAGHKRGGWYWKAYRKLHGKLSSLYLGKSETLSLEHLKVVAQELAPVPVAAVDAAAHGDTAPRTKADKPRDPLNLFLATKLHLPRPRAQLVRRSHLVEQLQQGMERALTLVSAPAGFGKTTLLSQWLV